MLVCSVVGYSSRSKREGGCGTFWQPMIGCWLADSMPVAVSQCSVALFGSPLIEIEMDGASDGRWQGDSVLRLVGFGGVCRRKGVYGMRLDHLPGKIRCSFLPHSSGTTPGRMV
jgi:hypothetical protein